MTAISTTSLAHLPRTIKVTLTVALGLFPAALVLLIVLVEAKADSLVELLHLLRLDPYLESSLQTLIEAERAQAPLISALMKLVSAGSVFAFVLLVMVWWPARANDLHTPSAPR